VRAYNGGLGQSPEWVTGAEPLVRDHWAKPSWSWKPFSFCMSKGNGKFGFFPMLALEDGNLQLMLWVQNRHKVPKKFLVPPQKKLSFGGRCSKMLCANLLIEPGIFLAQIACFYKDIIPTACPASLPSQNQSLNIRHYFEIFGFPAGWEG